MLWLFRFPEIATRFFDEIRATDVRSKKCVGILEGFRFLKLSFGTHKEASDSTRFLRQLNKLFELSLSAEVKYSIGCLLFKIAQQLPASSLTGNMLAWHTELSSIFVQYSLSSSSPLPHDLLVILQLPLTDLYVVKSQIQDWYFLDVHRWKHVVIWLEIFERVAVDADSCFLPSIHSREYPLRVSNHDGQISLWVEKARKAIVPHGTGYLWLYSQTGEASGLRLSWQKGKLLPFFSYIVTQLRYNKAAILCG